MKNLVVLTPEQYRNKMLQNVSSRKSKARDNQRSRVYEWEYSIRTLDRLSEQDCTTLVEKIWREYRTDCPPSIYFTGNRRRATGSRTAIKIPTWGMQPVVIIHETAHALLDRPDVAWHGPEFLGLMMELLVKYAGFDGNGLKLSVEEKGLRYI